VHADAQVVSFDTSSSITTAGLRRVLERFIPDDLWIIDVADVPSNFDARRSVLRRWYRYAIWREGVPPTAWQGRCLVNAEPLDLLVVELEAREARDVEQLFAVDSHSFGNLSRRDEAPCRGPRNARVPTVL